MCLYSREDRATGTFMQVSLTTEERLYQLNIRRISFDFNCRFHDAFEGQRRDQPVHGAGYEPSLEESQ